MVIYVLYFASSAAAITIKSTITTQTKKKEKHKTTKTIHRQTKAHNTKAWEAKVQGQQSVDSEDSVETNGQTD